MPAQVHNLEGLSCEGSGMQDYLDVPSRVWDRHNAGKLAAGWRHLPAEMTQRKELVNGEDPYEGVQECLQKFLLRRCAPRVGRPHGL